MNLKREDLVAKIEVEKDLKDFVFRLCDIYLQSRDGNSSEKEWAQYSGRIIEVIKEKLKSLPSGYWREGIFELAESYFSDAVQKGEVSSEDCERYIRKNLDPW